MNSSWRPTKQLRPSFIPISKRVFPVFFLGISGNIRDVLNLLSPLKQVCVLFCLMLHMLHIFLFFFKIFHPVFVAIIYSSFGQSQTRPTCECVCACVSAGSWCMRKLHSISAKQTTCNQHQQPKKCKAVQRGMKLANKLICLLFVENENAKKAHCQCKYPVERWKDGYNNCEARFDCTL